MRGNRGINIRTPAKMLYNINTINNMYNNDHIPPLLPSSYYYYYLFLMGLAASGHNLCLINA